MSGPGNFSQDAQPESPSPSRADSLTGIDNLLPGYDLHALPGKGLVDEICRLSEGDLDDIEKKLALVMKFKQAGDAKQAPPDVDQDDPDVKMFEELKAKHFMFGTAATKVSYSKPNRTVRALLETNLSPHREDMSLIVDCAGPLFNP
jgi:hypothetical protein